MKKPIKKKVALKKSAKKAAKQNVKPAAKKSATNPVKKVVKKVAKKAASAKKAATPPKKASAPKTAVPKKAIAKKPAPKKAVAAKPVAKPAVKAVVAKLPAPRRPKRFAAPETGRAFGFAPGAPELPESYGEDRLVLMAKDPEYLFAYWEVTPERLSEGERTKKQGQDYREAMRLNWEARDLFERNFAMLPVSLAARKWYLRVPFSGLAYHVEIGWLGDEGHFVSLLSSNRSDAPESWVATRRRLKSAGADEGVLAYNLDLAKPSGSSEHAAHGRAAADAAPLGWELGAPGNTSSSFTKAASGKPPRRG